MIKSELKIIIQLQNFGQIPLGSGHDITMNFEWMDGVFANNETAWEQVINNSIPIVTSP